MHKYLVGKMARLTAQLAEQFAESAKLEGEIKKNLAGLGYGLSTIELEKCNHVG